ncbi:hypothetical protein SARC_15914 [Sphaeroforma arctica JP610]|uniref:Uncharacterized protein n=1 Tax=Sphaeroforma arctica JP610 TaxID=667725 RepID=A0A0L0F4E0_9EUKA|nr:hypothetical protein SARC_15914 [Sphaeroforma arctica JP610]KNC71547.1 hypothetical protein SARC_15914 [Sphaeroforma arctica JP610]|eukprot:XP_014145449.1 hypothetical protein SARC_15914 [Sphaeroforma arctica JP610]
MIVWNYRCDRLGDDDGCDIDSVIWVVLYTRRKLVRRVIASDDDESDIASDDGAGKSKSKAAGLFNDSESEMSGSQQERYAHSRM